MWSLFSHVSSSFSWNHSARRLFYNPYCSFHLEAVYERWCSCKLVKWCHIPKCSWTNSYSPVNSSPFFLHVMSGGGFPLTEHLMWTSDPITVSWSWGGSVSHFGGSGRQRVRKASILRGKQWHPLEGAWLKRTFHDHVEVVNCFSGCVLGFTHVLPSIALLCVRQEQKLPKVVKFCLRGQLLSHFHPFYFRNGTTIIRNMVIRVKRQTRQEFVGWRRRACTYYPAGIHSSCRSSPFNTTFSVWTPGGSSMLGILIGGASGTGRGTIVTIAEVVG